MLPVSAWPPGPPGASLSPFGLPRQINVGCFTHGFVIPKGAWIVSTSSNQVVMFFPPVVHANPARSPGTGLLPGSMPQTRPPKCGCPPTPGPPPFRKFNDTPLQPPGRRPPNWFGWRFVKAPFSTLVPPVTTGQLVIADGQNVVITGSGFAAITQAYSV